MAKCGTPKGTHNSPATEFRKGFIECDGDYWHSIERVRKRDHAKNAYLTKCGFNLLRLPEHKIRTGEYLNELEEVLS